MSGFARPLSRPTTAGALCARLASASLIGNPDRPIRAIAALSSTAADALAFCDAGPEGGALAGSRAAVVIVPAGIRTPPHPDRSFIAVDDVRGAFIDAIDALLPGAARPPDPLPGVADGAHVDASASVSPLACVATGVRVGARSRIAPGAIVYPDTDIGSDCVVGPGAVVGWVGLAYHDRADGRRQFFPHLAGVRIGRGVDIGAHSCICRGMLSHTAIGDDAKIGSLVYVSHGVTLGPRTWVSAGTAIAGHSTIGRGTLLGIGSVIIDNIDVGPEAMVGGGSVVTKDSDAGSRLHGVPAAVVPTMRRFGPTPRD